MALLDVLANAPAEADRRLHSRAALLRRLGTDLVRERASEFARMMARSNEHSPGKFRVNGVVGKHAGVPEGVRLQGRRTDGAQAGVPGLVAAAFR